MPSLSWIMPKSLAFGKRMLTGQAIRGQGSIEREFMCDSIGKIDDDMIYVLYDNSIFYRK